MPPVDDVNRRWVSAEPGAHPSLSGAADEVFGLLLDAIVACQRDGLVREGNGSLFARAYLDQGKRHPRQMKGHRTATVLQRITDWKAREEKSPSRSFFAVVTAGVLEEQGGAM